MSCILLDALGLTGDHHEVAAAITSAVDGNTTGLDRLMTQINTGGDLHRLALAAKAVLAAVEREILHRGRIAAQNHVLWAPSGNEGASRG